MTTSGQYEVKQGTARASEGERFESREDRFCIRNRAVLACGYWDPSGFTVLRGSQVRLAEPGVARDRWRETRYRSQLRLIAEGVLERTDNGIRFARDHKFSSPSGAADAVLGTASNGWRLWVSRDGRPLGEVVPRG